MLDEMTKPKLFNICHIVGIQKSTYIVIRGFYDINMSNFEVPLQGHFIKHKHLFLKSYYTAPVEIPINSFCYRIVNIVKF